MPEKYPLVSVIVPVYNSEKYLRQCLDSIVNQTLKDIEIICVDDGSTDGSAAILNEYAIRDKRIKVLYRQNLSAGQARNTGMDVATGEYLSFLDSDDFFEPDMLEKLYLAAKSKNADMSMCNARKYDDTRHRFLPLEAFPAKTPDVITATDKNINFYDFIIPAAWNKLFRRTFVTDYNLRFQDIKFCNDIGFSFCAAAAAQKIAIVREALINYRFRHAGTLSCQRGRKDINILSAYLYIKEFLCRNHLQTMIDPLRRRIYAHIAGETSKYNSDDFDGLAAKCRDILQDDFPYFAKCFHYFEKRYCLCGLPIFEKTEKSLKTTYRLFGCITIKRKEVM